MDELNNVLVGVDFSPRSLAAAQMAIGLAEPAQAAVELVHVVDTQLSDSDALVLRKSKSELLDLLTDEARDALETFKAQLRYDKLRQTLLSGTAAAELTKLCEERKADLLVIGDTGAGSSVSPKGVGVTAYRLVERGPRRVLVVKAGHSGKIDSVAAAISFVPVADEVVGEAHMIARLMKAGLHIVRAIPDITELRYRVGPLPDDLQRLLRDSLRHNEKRLEKFVDEHEVRDVLVKTAVLSGNPGPVLVEYLHQQDIDLVVLGTGTSYRIAGYPVGSTTHRVLNQTLSSVLVVRSLEPPP